MLTLIKYIQNKIILVCFLLVTFCDATNAQNTLVDELYSKLKTATNPRQIIDIKNRIAYEMRGANADSSLALAQSTLVQAQVEKYEFGEATANICIAYSYDKKGSFQLVKEYNNRAYIIAEKLNNDSLKAVCNLCYSDIYENFGNYELAIEKALLAIKYFEKINNKDGVIKARVGMAQTYQIKNDLPNAEKILKELSVEDIDNKKTKVNILHTLANIYGMQEKYNEAFLLDEKALKICEAENLMFLKSSVYDNMANCYMYTHNYSKSKLYFYKCLTIDSSFGNSKQMSDTYLNLGQLSQMEGNVKSSIEYLKKAVALSQQAGYKQGCYEAYLLLSKAYNKINEKDSALLAVNKGYEIKDSLINEKSENKIIELETLFDTEKKVQQLALQKSDIAKKNILLFALGLMVLFIILSSFLYLRKRTLQNKILLQAEVLKQQDIATKAILEAEESERRRIAAELHDGVGQLMSVAKMNLSAFESNIKFEDDMQRSGFETIIHLVDESCAEIRSISHQMMPNALLKSGLAKAVNEFISKIDNRIIKVTLHTEGLNERLDGNIETVLYRVIQECVNNVLKHSKANRLDIAIIKDADGIAATIEDNGKGFDTSNKENRDGIGLKNIASRIKYLKGSIDYSSKIGSGTLVAIHIPL